MNKILLLIAFLAYSLTINAQFSDPDFIYTSNGTIEIQPVLHSSFILKWNKHTIYVDPYKDMAVYNKYPSPTLIVITDIHGDHLNQKTLEEFVTEQTTIVAPLAVKNLLSDELKAKTIVLNNGEQKYITGISLEAIPMYNLPEDDQSRHVKGRGNGYIITLAKTRIYISGDTEDIPEMRALKNIDVAFICMNLPYTMDLHTAADAVLDFNPKIVYPYHFRGKEDYTDVEAFKALVFEKNPEIEVRNRIWYQEN